MTVDRFIAERGERWDDLSALLDRAGGHAERLGADDVLRLGALYRAAAADLAAARGRYRGEPVVERLERLVATGRTTVYGARTRRHGIVELFGTTYWRRILERPVVLVVAALLLLVPAGLTAVWGASDPVGANRMVPGAIDAFGDPSRDLDLGIPADEQAAFASEIFTNNIRVTFLAFAGGITAGVLTVLILLSNGALLGAVGGISLAAGDGPRFVALVTPHGVLELSCIVVAGVAGLRMGWAIVDPGRQSRGARLLEESRAAVELVIGTVPWLVLAGLVEGFVTPAGGGVVLAVIEGVALGGTFWWLAWWRGRPSPVPRAGLAPSS